MSITVNQLSYIHPDREPLFRNIRFSVLEGQKTALIGKNGSGKSTLLQIIAGKIQPSGGEVIISEKPYYVPQHFGQFDGLTVSEAMGISQKINALRSILAGDASVRNFDLLNDDWEIEEKALAALSDQNLPQLSLLQSMNTLSGGEKTKVFLSGIAVHSPRVILMDEPSNHLDRKSREQLYEFIRTCKATLLIVSHDRTLLNLVEQTIELDKEEARIYGGNYEFYKAQEEIRLNNLQARLEEKEKQLKQEKRKARETAERKQKQNARGGKKATKEGVPRILMNTLRNRGEESMAKLNEVHSEKITDISNDLQQVRQQLADNQLLKMLFENSELHHGKTLVTAREINYGYTDQMLWEKALSFQIKSGERITIKGDNGSGKTTLIKLITGQLQPQTGLLTAADFNYLYADQEYSLISNTLSVLEQANRANCRNLPEHEIKTLLHRFVFPLETWNKPGNQLSGGEKMRLLFCCLAIGNNIPDMFLLDEPTNNLDIRSMEIITAALREYKGTVLIISHDRYLLDQLHIDREIDLSTCQIKTV